MQTQQIEQTVDQATFSEHLSRVLEDIGIRQDVVEKRRETFQHIEAMCRIFYYPTVVRFYGSQTEGTTTFDLKPDQDMLYIKTEWNIMQLNTDMQIGKLNMLMVKDRSTAPGYCRLHLRNKSEILLLILMPGSIHYTREGENICVLNNVMFAYIEPESKSVNLQHKRRGPSKQSYGQKNSDDVGALSLSSWPAESTSWLRNDRRSKWPTEQMRKVIQTHQCLLVPVGHQCSDRPQAEWRISYSETERYLMFNMNVVQLQCYVLLKLIRNRFLTKKVRSYYLKSVIFYTVERTDTKDWIPQVLFALVLRCLKTLNLWVQLGYCPHFFNSAVNLFDGKLSLNVRKTLHCRLTTLIELGYQLVYRINLDDLGLRMLTSLTNVANNRVLVSADDISAHIGLCLECTNIKRRSFSVNSTFQRSEGLSLLAKLIYFLQNGTLEEKAGAMVLLPETLANFPSIIVSFHMVLGTLIPENTLRFLTFGRTLASCISMSLKLATIYYRRGQSENSLKIIHKLETLESVAKGKLWTACWIYVTQLDRHVLTRGLQFAECVRFLRQERPICPFQLTFEMYRSTKFDRRFRFELVEDWLDTAELDPLPYLYYIKYLSCKAINLDEQASEAILELINLSSHSYLFHRETVLNIVGQFFESINDTKTAILFYKISLQERPINNAAKWLLGILVYRQFFKCSRRF